MLTAAMDAVGDGTVKVAYGSAQVERTTAVQEYVNALLVKLETGVTALVTHKEDNKYTVKFSKGDIKDTKDINMTINVRPDPAFVISAAEAGITLHVGISELYIFANGKDITVSEGANSSESLITTSIYVGGKAVDFSDAQEGNSSMAPSLVGDAIGGYDLRTGSIFGGGDSSATIQSIIDSTSVTMTGGKVKHLYGGGGTNSVSGNTVVTMTGGSTNYIYGGGIRGTANNTEVNVSGGSVGFLYGGGMSAEAIVYNNTVVNISGGKSSQGIHGGGESGVVNGSATINISGDACLENDVSGGGMFQNVVNGATINISGGTFWRAVRDGNSSQNNATCGNVSINISGGTLQGGIVKGYLAATSTFALNITGGNIRNINVPGVTPRNGTENVYRATFTEPESNKGKAFTITTPTGYNLSNAAAISDKWYIYLPIGAATASYDNITYSTTMQTDNYAVFELPFKPDKNITGVPTTVTVGTENVLTGTVVPQDATDQSISWKVLNVGTTGATINKGKLTTTAKGIVKIRASISNGLENNQTYTQDFTIIVAPTDIDAIAAAMKAVKDGKLNVAFGLTQEQITAAVLEYVNGLLTGDAAGVTATVTPKEGNNYTVAFV